MSPSIRWIRDFGVTKPANFVSDMGVACVGPPGAYQTNEILSVTSLAFSFPFYHSSLFPAFFCLFLAFKPTIHRPSSFFFYSRSVCCLTFSTSVLLIPFFAPSFFFLSFSLSISFLRDFSFSLNLLNKISVFFKYKDDDEREIVGVLISNCFYKKLDFSLDFLFVIFKFNFLSYKFFYICLYVGLLLVRIFFFLKQMKNLSILFHLFPFFLFSFLLRLLNLYFSLEEFFLFPFSLFYRVKACRLGRSAA